MTPGAVVSMTALPDVWRQRAVELERYAPTVAAALLDVAEELEASLHSVDDSVTLQEAHAIGGYSIDHLQRLVRRGTIVNVGTKGRVRIRRADVPTRPGHAPLRADGDGAFSGRRREAASVLGNRRES